MKTSKIHILIVGLFLLLFFSCSDEDNGNKPLNYSDYYSVCNSNLATCGSSSGEYCMFGFKWGAGNPFDPAGSDEEGPELPGGIITYSFQEENGFVSTHRQKDLPSKSFDELLPCAKTEIKKALNAWAAIANIEFEEMPENSDSDIKFYVADITQSGVGYPNYPDSPCTEIAGNMVIQADLNVDDCELFYLFVLHEIGHILGLGHVSTPNIMNPNFTKFDFDALQTGDSLGIIEIYGAKD
jgi:hypothetical protein